MVSFWISLSYQIYDLAYSSFRPSMKILPRKMSFFHFFFLSSLLLSSLPSSRSCFLPDSLFLPFPFFFVHTQFHFETRLSIVCQNPLTFRRFSNNSPVRVATFFCRDSRSRFEGVSQRYIYKYIRSERLLPLQLEIRVYSRIHLIHRRVF